MGLTIQYSLTYSGKSKTRVRKRIEQMHSLAKELPFYAVEDIIELENVDYNDIQDDGLRWLAIQAIEYAQIEERSSIVVNPTQLIAFTIIVGSGCEAMNIGLCLYPKEVKLQDGKIIKTNLKGWRWKSFCKTQYASNPKCGGVANFLKCHLSAIALLERIGELPGINLYLNDEGKYGPSNYSDDYKEAYAAGRTPTYVDHEGQYSVPALIKECGEWNEMIAGVAGHLKDTLSKEEKIEAEIYAYPNFEHLEFRGIQNNDEFNEFINAMGEIVKKMAAVAE